MGTQYKVPEAQHTETEITGKITTLYRNTDTFSAGRLSNEIISIDRDISFSVPCSAGTIGERITVHGEWKKDNKWGWQFKGTSITYPAPVVDTIEGLAHYLATNPAFKGIGPVRAKKIANEYHENFDEVLRNRPDELAAFAKLTPEQIISIQDEWILKADVNAISQWLGTFGLTHNQIKRIAEKYGNHARAVLEQDPYILCKELDGFGFSRTDEIALKMGIEKDHPGRIKSCLKFLVEDEAAQGGHTWVSQSALLALAIDRLAMDTLDSTEVIGKCLVEMCSSLPATLLSESTEVDGFREVLISSPEIKLQEMACIEGIIEAQKRPLPPWQDMDSHISRAVEATHKMPNADQMAAIKMALTSRISIMTGGAGTGKSFTIAVIASIVKNMREAPSPVEATTPVEANAEYTREPVVLLCAPTGKAAKRMSTLADGATASTIHRMLEYSPFAGWQYNENNKIYADLIVVDEVSMCDVFLMSKIMAAIDWNLTTLLLVGDHNQLPSIGPGNLLKDMLDNELVPSTRLIECQRAAGDLKLNANAILDGEVKPSSKPGASGIRDWRLVSKLEEPQAVVDAMLLLMDKYFEEWGFNPIKDCQIITCQNKGPLGVGRLNAELQRIWQRKSTGLMIPEIDPTAKQHRLQFLVGDKVMQIKNDYQIEVMNGTQGYIESIETLQGEKGPVSHMSIQFEDRTSPVAIELGSEREHNITHAYACTIHKVQGSEYPCVVSIIHKQHTYMLSRNLFYTAVTRARTSAIILGDHIGIRRAAKEIKSVNRRTWAGLEEISKWIKSQRSEQ